MSVPCLKMLAQFGYVIEYLRNVHILDIAIFDLFFLLSHCHFHYDDVIKICIYVSDSYYLSTV